MKEYIKKSSQKRVGEFPIVGWGINLVVADPITNNVSPTSVIERLKAKIPHKYIENIDAIYVGKFKHLEKMDHNASYMDGVIYVTSEQDSEYDMLDDIVHEIGHAVEELYGMSMYADKKIEREFLGKRHRLYDLLASEGYDVEPYQVDFLSPDYNQRLDSFFYMEVGYPFMEMLSSTLFYSPYGATSLREYFANGFESIYFSNNGNRLKKISPILYNKIKSIEGNE